MLKAVNYKSQIILKGYIAQINIYYIRNATWRNWRFDGVPMCCD